MPEACPYRSAIAFSDIDINDTMLRKNNFLVYIIVVITSLPFLQGCGEGNASSAGKLTELPMTHARLLSLSEGDGYTLAEVRNPWDTARTLHRYVLVERGAEAPELPFQATVVRVPLSRVVVSSVIHSSLIGDLGAADSIAGVCDAEWFNKPPMDRRIAGGEVADCGNSMAPDVERMLRLRAGAIFVAPFQNNGGYGKIDQAGIPVIECADYMETSPLGRAEWMRFYGRLFGQGAVADSLFDATESQYDQLAAVGRKASTKPSVLVDRIYGQSWNVPGGESTLGRLIEDAGGRNIFERYRRSGSVALAPEKVLYEGAGADVWLIRYNDDRGPLTLEELGGESPLYPRVAAFGRGDVYGVNTSVSSYYSDMPFHPQWVLADVIGVLHPEAGVNPSRHYFLRLSPR